jgi:DUF1009 family protein
MTTRPDRPHIGSKPTARIAIIAGGGGLPVAVAASLAARELDPFVFVVAGEADPAEFAGIEHTVMRLEQFPQAIAMMKSMGVDRLVLAGSIGRRVALRHIRWNLPMLKTLPRLARALARGDDGLLRTVVGIFEGEGIRIVGAQDIVPDLLAPAGCLTRAQPGQDGWRDINAACRAALMIGRLDIGQAAIAIGGRAVALEGVEGTDGLLERTVALRTNRRIARHKGGALVKLSKPGQELRVDLPGLGPETITRVVRAGLAGIAVDAGRAFLLDHERTIASANEAGLFVVGLTSAEIEAAERMP